jgi:poly-gamma-glutamate synthesis protein (capsule biosynthesis protein)
LDDIGILPTPLSQSTIVVQNPTPITDNDEAYYLFLPVVAFPSLQANITMDQLQTIRAGLLDANLVINQSSADQLQSFGVSLDLGTRIVADDSLFTTLWQDRRKYTLLPFNQLTPRYRALHVDEIYPLDLDLSVYPFAFKNEMPNYNPTHLTRLLMSGVTALTRDTRTALDNNGIEWAAEAILPDVSHADFFHTSNEVSIYPTCPQTDGPLYGGALSFCSKPENFDLLDLLGVDIVELTGNHNNDYGYEAYLQTLSWYRDHDITTVGGGETVEDARRPVYINHNGNSIVLVSCNWIGPYYALANEDPLATGGVRPGAAFCDEEWLRNTLPVLSAENDLLVVSVQYLEHDQYTPTTQQQYDFRMLANLGADVVIGTQAHFPQTIEFYPRASDTEAFIHYGLGNLFFDQTFFAGRRFFMDQLFIYDGQLLNVDLFTGIIDDQARPRPMTPDERENFLYLMMIEYGGY